MFLCWACLVADGDESGAVDMSLFDIDIGP